MILVDTSIWIDHFRRHDRALETVLQAGLVMCHPFVVGELACGTLRDRTTKLAALARLPQAPVAGHAEVLAFVERHALFGRGIGWLDTHLLASSALVGHGKLWTRDKRLAVLAAERDLAFEPAAH